MSFRSENESGVIGPPASVAHTIAHTRLVWLKCRRRGRRRVRVRRGRRAEPGYIIRAGGRGRRRAGRRVTASTNPALKGASRAGRQARANGRAGFIFLLPRTGAFNEPELCTLCNPVGFAVPAFWKGAMPTVDVCRVN